MPGLKKIPIIDLFAGPGGLGEGFSSVMKDNERTFEIKVSIEKDEHAHQTLELRSFTRQFDSGKLPAAYYAMIREPNLKNRSVLRKALFEKYPDEAEHARKEAWKCELGSEDFPSEVIDKRIRKELNEVKDWVFGGPPCQAYSLAGRSRVGGIDKDDGRVFLYKQYLRIIAVHHPAVFVMENVKGLLSAQLEGERIFDWIKRDLQDPRSIFPDRKSPKYKVFSLSTLPTGVDESGNPTYGRDMDFLIKAEDYGVPQKRHRVILLGVREDIEFDLEILQPKTKVTVHQAIGDLPKLRSGIGRSMTNSIAEDGKKQRSYTNIQDSDEVWKDIVNEFRKNIISWNGFAKDYSTASIDAPEMARGGEFIKCATPSVSNPLFDWYNDPRLGGIGNHESRSHLQLDLQRYLFSSIFSDKYGRSPKLTEFAAHSTDLLPDHANAESGKFSDRFRTQLKDEPATTITSHISKDGHYFIHYDPNQCRSLTVREAARLQTFPDNYLFWGNRTTQYHQVGNAVPPYLAKQIGEIVSNILIE